jgi:transposase
MKRYLTARRPRKPNRGDPWYSYSEKPPLTIKARPIEIDPCPLCGGPSDLAHWRECSQSMRSVESPPEPQEPAAAQPTDDHQTPGPP